MLNLHFAEWCQRIYAWYVWLWKWYMVMSLIRRPMLQLYLFRKCAFIRLLFCVRSFPCFMLFWTSSCKTLNDQQPAINVLKEFQAFLQANPSEIVTIIIEDYVTSPKGLTNVFAAAGLGKFWFPVSRMPKNGGDWPTVSDMIQKNQRLLVFTSKAAKEASEGIAYVWTYMVENQCKSFHNSPDWIKLWKSNSFFFSVIQSFYRWRWRDDGRFMPQPRRITTHEHDFEVARNRKFLQKCCKFPWSLQGQLSSITQHGEHLL